MNNNRKAPSSPGTLSRGIKQNIHLKDKSINLSGQTQNDAKHVAEVLIRLQQQFPDFFRDIKPDDPDLDQDSDFEEYSKIVRMTDER